MTPHIKFDHFLVLLPLHLEQFVTFLLKMLTPDDQLPLLENIRVLDGMLWLRVAAGWSCFATNLDHFSRTFPQLALLISLLKVFRLMIQTMLSPIFQS